MAEPADPVVREISNFFGSNYSQEIDSSPSDTEPVFTSKEEILAFERFLYNKRRADANKQLINAMKYKQPHLKPVSQPARPAPRQQSFYHQNNLKSIYESNWPRQEKVTESPSDDVFDVMLEARREALKQEALQQRNALLEYEVDYAGYQQLSELEDKILDKFNQEDVAMGEILRDFTYFKF